MLIDRLINTAKRHPVMIWFLAFLIVGLLFLSEYGFLYVSTSSKENVFINVKNSKTFSKKPIKSGLNFVKRGNYIVVATTAKQKTEKNVVVRGFLTSRVHLDLLDQKKITKVASKSLGCVIPTPAITRAPQAYTYTCGAVTPYISSYAFTNKPTITKRYDQPFYSLTSYRDGLLGLTTTAGSEDQLQLVYTDGTTITPVDYRAGALNDPSSFSIQVLDPASGGGAFALTDTARQKITFFSDMTTKIGEIELGSTNAVKYSYTTYGGKLFVLAVPTSTTRGAENEKLKGGTLKTYYLSGKQVLQDPVFNVPKDESLFGMQAVSDKVFINRDVTGKLRVLSLAGKSMKTRDEISDTNNFIAGVNTFLYSKGGDIFRYDLSTTESVLVYNFSELQPSSLQRSGQNFFLSALDKVNGVQFSFLLDQKESRTESIENILSVPSKQNSVVRFLDYSNKTIYAELNLASFTSDHETGQFIFDEGEVKTKKDTLIQSIQRLGIDPSSYTLVTE